MPTLSRPPHPPPPVLVTGGPTRAYLDDVRYISNYSTGELAYEICSALKRARIPVVAVIGPTSLPFEKLRLKHLARVESLDQMRSEVLNACRKYRPSHGVFSAAVLDFVPAKTAKGKVSSKKRDWVLRLKPAPKIIDEVARKFPRLERIGFKLEWGAVSSTYGRKILAEKAYHALVLNSLSKIKNGRHPALLVDKDGRTRSAKTKKEIAAWIRTLVMQR